jgi:cell division protein FtsB
MGSNRSLYALGAATALFALLLGSAWFKQNGYTDVAELKRAIADVDGEIERVRKENSRLAARLTRITTDDGYVEAVARENLGLVKPGELVFEFIEEDRLAWPDRPRVVDAEAPPAIR